MLEQYLSEQLSIIEEKLKNSKDIIDNNSKIKNDANEQIKDLNKQIDPFFEIFSPLKINANIKKNIAIATEQINKAKTDIKIAKDDIENLENKRIKIVSMLSTFRQNTYKLDRYELCDFPNTLNLLKEKLENAKNLPMNKVAITKLHNECIAIIEECMEKFKNKR